MNERWQRLDEQIHHLDMVGVRTAIREAWPKAYGAAFVLDDGESPLPKYCALRIRTDMTTLTDIGIEPGRSEIVLQAAAGQDRRAILISLAQDLGLSLAEGALANATPARLAEAIVECLVGRVKIGKPYLVTIRTLETLRSERPGELVAWLAQTLAAPIHAQLTDPDLGARCYFLLVAGDPLDDEEWTGSAVPVEQWAYDKGIRVPRPQINETELGRWLRVHGAFTSPDDLTYVLQRCRNRTRFPDLHRNLETILREM